MTSHDECGRWRRRRRRREKAAFGGYGTVTAGADRV